MIRECKALKSCQNKEWQPGRMAPMYYLAVARIGLAHSDCRLVTLQDPSCSMQAIEHSSQRLQTDSGRRNHRSQGPRSDGLPAPDVRSDRVRPDATGRPMGVLYSLLSRRFSSSHWLPTLCASCEAHQAPPALRWATEGGAKLKRKGRAQCCSWLNCMTNKQQTQQ